MLNSNFVILAGIINLLGSLSYIIEILKGKVKPNKVTWLLWGIAPLVTFLAEVSQGVGLSSFFTLTVALGPLFIFLVASFDKKAYWKITKFDIFCGLISLLALVAWLFTRVGNLAIIISIIADVFAGAPTIVKIWKTPETEDYKAFLASVVAVVMTLLTIRVWNFASVAFPIYILTVCTYFTLAILFPKFRPFKKQII